MALKKPNELYDGMKFETIYLEDGETISPEEQRQMYLEDLDDELQNLHFKISDPEVFGPYLRDAINIIMLGMNETNKHKQGAFLSTLSDVLPCGECANHLKEFLKMYPTDTQTRIRYAQYIMRLHNQVNTRNDKQEWNITQYTQYLSDKYSLPSNDANDETKEETDTL